jgi:hypothetical protein
LITRKLKAQIDYLHGACGATEWSGELITSEKGSINDPDKWRIIGEDIYLADIGTPGGTGYEVGKGAYAPADIVEMFELYPDIAEGKKKAQHIHSHHSMSTFFSPTDYEQLNDRALSSNYLLMLIVNFRGEYKAKVAFVAKEEGKKSTKLVFANNADGFKPLTLSSPTDKQVLVVMDCKVEFEEVLISTEFKERLKVVEDAVKRREEEKEKERKSRSTQSFSRYMGGSVPQRIPFQDGYDDISDGATDSKKRSKRISEMTDKEFYATQEVETPFQFKHVRVLLNSMIDGTYTPFDFSDPVKRLEKESSRMAEYEVVNWCDEFSERLGEHFDILFPGKSVNDYVSFLETMKRYLYPYKANILIDGIIDEVDAEITVNKHATLDD